MGDTGFEPHSMRLVESGSDLRVNPLTCEYEEQYLATAARGAASVTYEGFEFKLDGLLHEEIELSRSLIEAVQVARQKGRKGLVVLLDEAQLLTDDKRSEGLPTLRPADCAR